MAILDVITGTSGDQLITFYCPGCGSPHKVRISPPSGGSGRPAWDWNGSLDAPTFRPSILSRIDYTDPDRPASICHSYVTDGQIRFLTDCTHSMAGQTQPIPPYPQLAQ
jgi:hypothetical protein